MHYHNTYCIDGCRSHGGIQTAIEIWEMAALPYLTNNCDTWSGLSGNAIKELDNLQNLFYRVILQVPTGCPIPMLYWDCGGLLMSNLITQKKLLFLHHIATLSSDSLAHQVYLEQKRLRLPGLVAECQELLVEFDIMKITDYTKLQWKRLIKNKILMKNRNDLLEKMKKYKKIDYKCMSDENFELKPYFKNLHLSQARDKFRIRSFMTRTVKLNFVSDKKFAADLWSCWHCQSIDSQAHVRICPAYEHLRIDKDLDNDIHLVQYFRDVIKMRDDLTN